MESQKLGVIKKITDLRSVWPHEAYDFSKWLAQEDNLSELSNSIGIDIALEELESQVGEFSVDIYAVEQGTDRKIVIENQLEDTNHDHLGKIITYAAGKGAEVIVWIVKRARDEHRQAIEWLNTHTDSNIGVFLVEIELWQIDDSPYAPKFNVVERPNDWTKSMKMINSLSGAKKLQLEFWQSFADYAFNNSEFAQVFSRRKALPQHWYSLSLGNSKFHLDLLVNTQKKQISAQIYIPGDKSVFEFFKSHEDEVEREFGSKLEWKEAAKSSSITAVHSGDIRDEDLYTNFFEWFIEASIKLKKISKIYIDKI